MIILQKVNLAFGKQIVFDNISCNINRDARIGLVGRNGSGKSTLLKALAGQQGIDDGSITIEKGGTVGYMPQEVVLHSNKTIFQEALSAFKEIHELLEELTTLEDKLSDPIIVERYAHIQERLIELDASDIEIETKKILSGLGFSEERFEEPVSNLSVGWRMRLVLAKLLLQKADFYLFDEPTNHLDITTKDWFLNFLKHSQFGFILVCHDRYFLDHLCEKTLEIERGKAVFYNGNYSLYVEQKEQRTAELEKSAERQQKEIAEKMRTVERFRASASKAKMAQSMLKRIDKIERIETVRQVKTMAFSFPPAERSGKIVLQVENVSHSFGAKQIFKNVNFEVERGERVAIVAANGVGKTTLFNLATGKLEVQGDGHIQFGHNVTAALFEQDQDKVLSRENTILDEVEGCCLDTETRSLVRKFLGSFLFSGDDVQKKIAVLSGGEKNRVAMVKVLLQKSNFLLLDEPTNHLDIQSKEILLNALQQFTGTILFVSHDRDFLDKLATRILELSAKGVVSYSGNYESYLYHKEKLEVAKEQPKQVEKKQEVQKVDNKEQHERRRMINKLEGKIERLETKIKTLTHELEEAQFANPSASADKLNSILTSLGDAKKDLDTSVAEWEELQI